MAHIEDRWHRTVRGADGRPEKARTARYGKGLRWRARYIDPDGDEHNRSFSTKVLRSVRDFARKEWPLRGSSADVLR